MFLIFYEISVSIVRCPLYFCRVLFAQNGTVDVRDLRELQGMGLLLGSFPVSWKENKKTLYYIAGKHVSVHLSTKMMQRYK